jgi:hypothetical protein
MVALLDVVHAGADLDDLAGAFVAEHDRRRRGLSPLTSDRSEWQRPAPPTLTSTSPSPGGSRSSSRIWMGFDFANGRGEPQAVRTAALVFIGSFLQGHRVLAAPKARDSGFPGCQDRL